MRLPLKRVSIITAALLVAATIFGFVSNAVLAATTYPNYEAYLTERTTFIKTLNDPATYSTPEVFGAFITTKSPILVQSMSKAILELVGTGLIGDKRIALDVGRSKTALQNYAAAIYKNDAIAISTTATEFENAINSEIDNLQKLNAASKAPDTKLRVYVALAAFFTTISLGTFIWSRRDAAVQSAHPLHAQKSNELAKYQKFTLFKSTLVMSGASLITLAWYMYASKQGGSYFILWGPMVFGFVALLKGIQNYVVQVKSGSFAAQAESVEKKRGKGTIEFSLYSTKGSIMRKKNIKKTHITFNMHEEIMILSVEGAEPITITKSQVNRITIGSMLVLLLKRNQVYWFAIKPDSFRRTMNSKLPLNDSNEKQQLIDIADTMQIVFEKAALGLSNMRG